jgi:Ras-related protein Rab-7A
MAEDIKREFVFKVVLMGEGSVGKTSIRSKFMGAGFKSDYIKTIGADFASKAITIGENKVHFQVWDLAGQKMYKHVRSSFYSGCKCGFLVFDLTVPETLTKLDEWVDESLEHSGGFLKIFIVLGNKHDLKDQIKVTDEEVEKFVDKLKKEKGIETQYLLTSAKTGENIEEAFRRMGKMFLEHEGFPRNGRNAELNDTILEKHYQETQEIVQASTAQIKKKEAELLKGNSEDTKKLKETLELISDRIDRLTEITTALEERLLLVETKPYQETSEVISNLSALREKIDQLDKSTEGKVAESGDNEEPMTEEEKETEPPIMLPKIPIPTIEDISSETPEETAFEKIDRSSLETMEVVHENNEEETADDEIAEILDETEKISEEKSEIDTVSRDTEESINNGKAVQPPEDQEKETIETTAKDEQVQTRCPKCGTKLSYIKQYDRWYCYRCRIYV